MSEHYSNVSNDENDPNNIKRKIWAKLDENPLLTPKDIAQLCDLPYKQYRNYITKERSNWKYYHKDERGSKCSESHHCRYRGKVLGSEVNRVTALSRGWVQSRAKNRFFIYTSKLGRIVWYETGRLRLFVRKPANEAKAKTLFCEAFFKNYLITDIKVLDTCLARIAVKGAHSVFPTNTRLPNVVIDSFVDSHGVLIKIGDRSHPNSVEVIWEVTNRQEKLEEQVGFVYDVFQQVNGSKVGGFNGPERLSPKIDKREDYSR